MKNKNFQAGLIIGLAHLLIMGCRIQKLKKKKPSKYCFSFMLDQVTACECALGNMYFVRRFYFALFLQSYRGSSSLQSLKSDCK